MKVKKTVILLLALFMLAMCLPTAALAEETWDVSGDLDVEGPTKHEILAKWEQVTSATEVYEVTPSVSAPYAAGSLSDSFLESGITYLNYVRYVAKLPAVQLNDTLNEDAQYGAVVLAANDLLTHYPEQPSDMDDDFYERGCSATTSSNISARWGSYSRLTGLQSAVSGCMADSGNVSNLGCVGHRRWLLNPTLLNVGFGYAESTSGASYIVTKVFDRSGSGIDYDFVAWPASGNFPTNLFATTTPWSITLNPSKYQKPNVDNVKITITRVSDGKTWEFDSTTGAAESTSKAYMVVENSGYGVSNCIIFHPGSANIDAYEGVFNVEVSGIYDKSGNAATLCYQVDFFDINSDSVHDYNTVIVTEPTCTEQGYTTHICSCGKSYVDSYVDAKGHTYDGGTVTTAPTCTQPGVKTYACTACGSTKTEEIAALGHSYGDWYIQTSATCTEKGEERHDCENCDHYETREIAAKGHSYESAVTAPSCTERGYTTHTCTVCADSYIDSYVDALGHCAGETKIENRREATCTENGSYDEVVCCSVCGSEISRVTVVDAALGHTYDDGTVTTAPTCTQPGVKTYTCTVCGTTKTEEIAALGHSYGDWYIQISATCTEKGVERHDCENCDHYETREIAAKGHSYGEWRAVTTPTCTETGEETHECSVCHATETREIAPLGHDYEDGACTRCGAEDPDYVSVTRIAGGNRCATAIKVADELKQVLDVEKFDTIIIASGNNFADALAGSYLAAVKNAPILLSYGASDSSMNANNIAYINGNLAPGGTVYILGGVKAVPGFYEEALTDYNVQRLGGADRFETNIKILEEAGVSNGQEILVCTSTNYADSLSASATALPILLVRNETGVLYSSQLAFLESLEGNTFCIIGGEKAVSAKLETAISDYGTVTRLAGTNRYETSVLVAEKYFNAPEFAVLAYARNYPDGLCGGSLAYAMNAPLILTQTGSETQAAGYIQGLKIQEGIVLGGEKLISDEAIRTIFSPNAVIICK